MIDSWGVLPPVEMLYSLRMAERGWKEGAWRNWAACHCSKPEINKERGETRLKRKTNLVQLIKMRCPIKHII